MDDAAECDIGSSMCEADLAGDETPPSVLPSIVGHIVQKDKIIGLSQKEHYVGDEAVAMQDDSLVVRSWWLVC
jgi:actin beta/gamma 1